MDTLSSAMIVAQSTGWIISIFAGSAIGVLFGFMFIRWLGRSRIEATRIEVERTISEAQAEAEVIRKTAEVDAKGEFLKGQEQLRRESTEMRAELKEIERRLTKREDNIEGKLDTLTSKEKKLEQDRARLDGRLEQARKKEQEAEALIAEQRERLLKVAGMTVAEARQSILDELKHELDQECAELIEKATGSAKDEAQQRSREITLTAIQRYASEHTCDSVVSSVEIPSDDMKGRVIGREGRNIRAFEKATGVDVIVDDTPGLVLVSAFDPVRREVARRSLERLIQDGRIHPGRIEELVGQVGKEVEED